MTPVSLPVQPASPASPATVVSSPQSNVPTPDKAAADPAPIFEVLHRQMQAAIVQPQTVAATGAAPTLVPTMPPAAAGGEDDLPDTDLPEANGDEAIAPSLALLMPWAPPVAASAPAPQAAVLGEVSSRTGLAPTPSRPSPDLAKTAPVLGFADTQADTGDGDAADFAQSLLTALGNSAQHVQAPSHRPAFDFAAATPIADAQPLLDMRSDAWLDRLAQDITASASSDGRLNFRIVPPQLGRLDISIETRDAGVAVHMKTDTSDAQALIANAQPRLHDAFAAHGLRVAETSVTQNGGGDLPRPHFIPQEPLIEAVNDPEPEAVAPTYGQPAGRFA